MEGRRIFTRRWRSILRQPEARNKALPGFIMTGRENWRSRSHVCSCLQVHSILLTAQLKFLKRDSDHGGNQGTPLRKESRGACDLSLLSGHEDSGDGGCVWEEALQLSFIKHRASQWLTESCLSSHFPPLCAGAKGVWRSSQSCWN